MIATVQFDPEPLSDLGDPETERELIDLFLAQAVDRVSRLERAIDASDSALVRELAHELKGASSTVGAIAVSGLCQRLCEVARGADAREIHGELVRALGATGATMRRYTADLAG